MKTGYSMEKHSTGLAYLMAAATAALGGLTLQDVAVIAGIIATLGTFAVNWYYRAKADRRAEKAQEADKSGRRSVYE